MLVSIKSPMKTCTLYSAFAVSLLWSLGPVLSAAQSRSDWNQGSGEPQKNSRSKEFANDDEPCPGTRKKTGQAEFRDYVVRTYRYPNSFGCFVISRGGRAVYKKTSMDFQIGGSPSLPLEGKQNQLTPIGTDVTALGQPDLVVGEWTGGAHCCFLFHVFELQPTRLRKVSTIDAEHNDLSRFEDVDHDGRLEFLTSDWTFAYWHTGFMQSPAPDIVLRFRDGKFRLAPDVMRKPNQQGKNLAADANRIAAKWDSSEEGPPHEYWGELLDLIYSGNAGRAWKFAEEAWPRDKPGRERFIQEFKEQLKASPYWEELKELNGHDLR